MNGIDYGNWIFYFSNGKLKLKENLEMVRELASGDIIMSLVKLSRYLSYSKLGERREMD
ncbi:MAG: hypothetical protein CM15mP109_07230 [Candidatus Dadabacteria bacterium]|nr:MAG: hypothetical protein CM15mP109_07230 [Candidatus Dadabacteria bacterium]